MVRVLHITLLKRQFFLKIKVMKKLILTPILALLLMAGNTLKAQNNEYLGLPGDNLNLYAVMNLFQESPTIEDFEKKLNAEDSRINNLDLNNDNYVDYISVTDYPDGNVHNIVLQVALGPNEKQDVAVFTVQRLRNGDVQIQLVGDEALYGRNYVIEPNYADTPNPGYSGRAARNRNETVVNYTYYDIAAWPVIRFIYDPYYVAWHSSWYWGYYPTYWHAWSPCWYHEYYGYHYHYYPVYYSHYRHWNEIRYDGYRTRYYSHMRSYSPTVVVNINKGHYKSTYSHPESRRNGEALYSRTHSDRSSTMRRSDSRVSSSSNVSRRSSVNEGRTRNQTNSNGTVRRSDSPVERGARQSSGSVRRESVNVDRNVRNQSSSGSVRRETTSVNRNMNQSSGSVRRSAPENGNRQVMTSSSSSRVSPSSGDMNQRRSISNQRSYSGSSQRSSGSYSAPSARSSRTEQVRRSESVRSTRQSSSGSASRGGSGSNSSRSTSARRSESGSRSSDSGSDRRR